VLSGVAVVLLAVAMAASLVPAVRAKQVDPMEALRAE
jgi:ABC-type lipoprotein release transport system permease subunit